MKIVVYSSTICTTVKSLKHEKKYRLYRNDKLANAFNAVKVDGMSVRGAAKKFGIPPQTLRDRITGRIDVDCVTTGRTLVLDMEEEAKLVQKLSSVADLGYGYTRQEVTDLASDYALQLEKRRNPFNLNWFEGFRNRWETIKVLKPRSLEYARAKNASPETINKYFLELENISTKYNLHNCPHLIYNIDEKGFVPNHKPPHVVASADHHPQAVTSEKSYVTTVIGARSASGVAVPPFFIFAGARIYVTRSAKRLFSRK
ncbi:hypothetical protein KUTeg_010323 [Tegillarca granosa]|uniref:HTH psq-type domain-containing protein n=1 Tax=Tegillarca granosa TaxID=220873 RepID=A0ABQ9F6D5_TEGGR|nr:hypothetical protein KUTeg_010323 [Tegillarca granosa]